LVHTKPLAKSKQAFELAPYQQFVVYNIFLVNCETKLRRINFVYDAVARKMGKPLLSGLGLYFNLWMAKPDRKSMWAPLKKHKRKRFGKAFAFVNQSLLLRTLGFRNKAREIMFDKRKFRIFRFGR
jgi:phage terminase large subunit-like protein